MLAAIGRQAGASADMAMAVQGLELAARGFELAARGFELAARGFELAAPRAGAGFHRVGEVAMYGVDALCRRSKYLQQTVHAETAFVGLNPDDAGRKGLADGHQVKVSQGSAAVTLPVRICAELPAGAVWVKSATDVSAGLGDSFGPISVEAA
jgi:NADH-quinone oxidoreductase subunit G